VDLERIDLLRLDLQELVVEFTKEEIAKVVQETLADCALGPDGFMRRFYHAAWPVKALVWFWIIDET